MFIFTQNVKRVLQTVARGMPTAPKKHVYESISAPEHWPGLIKRGCEGSLFMAIFQCDGKRLWLSNDYSYFTKVYGPGLFRLMKLLAIHTFSPEYWHRWPFFLFLELFTEKNLCTSFCCIEETGSLAGRLKHPIFLLIIRERVHILSLVFLAHEGLRQ